MELLNTDHPLARALAQRGYTDLTAVQSAVLAPETQGRDLLVSAQTGSGKTVAYGLALADTILGDSERLPPAGAPLALVVAPTRELALQVRTELEWLYQAAGGRVVACVGGMDPRAERRTLAQGTHIVVGTPGRLRDHLERGGLDASCLRAVVLDEADEMLDMGFREDLEAILDEVPAERRTLLFSATLPREITDMAKRYQRDAWRISLAAGAHGHADIEHKAIRVAPTEIEHAVVNTLRYFDAPTAMVFCGTREAVRHLQSGLLERGFGVVALSGELSQNERNKALQELRDGRARVCVATDVAARGIDLPNLDLVIHAELPRTAETMQHRSGRTGRAGRKGVSVLMVPLSRWRRAQQLLHSAGVQAEWISAPSADDIRALDQQRLLTHPMFDEVSGDDDLAMAKTLLEGRSAHDVALALVRLYRSRLPAPEEIFAASAEAPPAGGGFAAGPDKPRRPRRDEARGDGDAVWFRLNIGRQKNADPRWILPLICRQGHVSKQDIGAIRIYDRDTRFEVAASVAERFLAAIRTVKNPEGRIEPVEGVEAGEFRKPPRPPQGPRPAGERPAADRSQAPRPQGDKPFKGKSFKIKPGKKPQIQD
ncbi:MAG: DEAD/DEAH box helicase [Magnetospirillum sp.]|nr:DEAD/DEAH box helicase [Magnetospirillum sp.]